MLISCLKAGGDETKSINGKIWTFKVRENGYCIASDGDFGYFNCISMEACIDAIKKRK